MIGDDAHVPHRKTTFFRDLRRARGRVCGGGGREAQQCRQLSRLLASGPQHLHDLGLRCVCVCRASCCKLSSATRGNEYFILSACSMPSPCSNVFRCKENAYLILSPTLARPPHTDKTIVAHDMRSLAAPLYVSSSLSRRSSLGSLLDEMLVR